MSPVDFPKPVDGYDHRYAWNCTLINEMVWWPTLNSYERARISEMQAWNAKFLELQERGELMTPDEKRRQKSPRRLVGRNQEHDSE